MDLTHTSTLVIMPPNEQWQQFVDIKKNHMNPKIKRPPYPHITLMQPFIKQEKFDEVEILLEEGLKEFQPFNCTIKEFKIYDNNKSQTLYLNPECDPPESLSNLYNKIVEIFPQGDLKRGFDAHIGIGYFKDKKLSFELMTKYQAEWKPIEFLIDKIYINFRKSDVDPFEPVKIIKLGKNLS